MTITMMTKNLHSTISKRLPSVSCDSADYKSSMMRAFSIFSSEFEREDGAALINEYSRLHGTGQKVSKSGVGVYTFGCLAGIFLCGGKLKDTDRERLDQFIADCNANQEEEAGESTEAVAVTTKGPSIQDAVLDKAREYIGEFEGMIDDAICLDLYGIDIAKHLTAIDPGVVYARHFRNWIDKKIAALPIGSDVDRETKQAWANVNTRKLAQMLDKWKTAFVQYENFKKANRKPKARKPKTPLQQTKGIKYLKEFAPLALTGINPTQMIGTEQVWIYNTKTRKLTVYKAVDKGGIQAKGSSLQNWDPEQSETKTVTESKAKTIISKVQTAGKLALRKIMTETSKRQGTTPNGRLNEHCVIIRAL